MKKTILFLLLAFASQLLHAQLYVDGKNISTEFKGQYLTIKEGRMVDKVNNAIEVDYGQVPGKGVEADRLTDSTGKAMGFASIVAAMNYFYEQGWEFEAFLIGGDYVSKRYLLKRMK